MSKTQGSNKRQRPLILTARVTPQEKATVAAKAKDYPGGVSEMFRISVLNMRPRPSQVDCQENAKMLAALGKIAYPLMGACNNLNQLTHYAHMDRLMAAKIAETLEDLQEVLRDLKEMRTPIMLALGHERHRSGE